MNIVSLNLYEYLLSSTIPIDELIQIEKTFYNTIQDFWREHNLYTWQWWLLVILSILSPIFYWIFINKIRITEVTAYGLFYGVSAIILDSIGSNAMAWTYPIRLTPYLFPQLYPYDIGIVIIPFMLIYQRWGDNFKKFFLISGFQSAFLAFVAEQFLEFFNIYQEITWKNIYSFPIYWLLAIICWFIITRFKKIEQR
ncbi:hypothetical protein E2K98_29990 [Bacillus salipaludis]|uniref:CBO0543 family protein n=1 Tax=Bacillus salipaludis TaxID=2547811 RepID=A0A4R5VHZ0_9BACI|nr:CBO0543 family protein [Bacillus salipaludis]MDQ6598962.1 CBO0543 family protein [Bacillus salipaludis]TDK54038.1 hypothetical protein E2K98_29990 [Bacillus salipaludis]